MAVQRFLYCLDTPRNGMQRFEFGEHGPFYLPQWNNLNPLRSDRELLEWLRISEVGDYCIHRMGTVIRLSDVPAGVPLRTPHSASV